MAIIFIVKINSLVWCLSSLSRSVYDVTAAKRVCVSWHRQSGRTKGTILDESASQEWDRFLLQGKTPTPTLSKI